MPASAHEVQPQQIDLKYEGSIVSTSQPMLTYQQTRAMFGNFGTVNSLETLLYKRTGESDDIAFEVNVGELEHTLSIRKTHSDLCSIIDVFCRRIYDLPDDLVRKVGSSAIVDIGAYNGTTPSFFASHYLDSKILAIEPNPRNYPLLTRNTAPYGDQVYSVQAAAAPSTGHVFKGEFGFKTDSMQNAFMLNTDRTYSDVVSSGFSAENTAINTITADDIMRGLGGVELGILKIDIEGAEKPLFESTAIDELLRQTGVLLVETHDQFMPGASEAVYNAATRNGLILSSYSPHTDVYHRP